jgi:hypothetical protein
MRTWIFLPILLFLTTAAFAQAGGEFRDIPRPKTPETIPDMGTTVIPQLSQPDPAINKPTNDALDKIVDKETFENTPLSQALDRFAKDAHLNLNVNWEALKSAGVEPATLVSLNVSEIPARKILSVLLAQAGHGTADLHFVVDNNQVVISTKDDLTSSKYQTVVVYDLRFLYADMEIDSPQAAQIADGIIDTIKGTFDPSSWRDAGGTVGYIRSLNGYLIINQTAENHELIAKFIKEMASGTPSATRAYDVRDLIKPDPAPANASTQPAEPNPKIQALISAIQANCGRDTWRDQGNKTSSIAYFDDKLYITTKPAVHDQIDRLLALIRKKD